LDLDAQDVVGLVVAEHAHALGIAVEDERPLRRRRDDEERVRAGRYRLAVDDHVLAEGELRRSVGAGAPDLVVGHHAAPDLAVLHARARVLDPDLGDAEKLRELGVRARSRQLDLLREGAGCEQDCGGEDADSGEIFHAFSLTSRGVGDNEPKDNRPHPQQSGQCPCVIQSTYDGASFAVRAIIVSTSLMMRGFFVLAFVAGCGPSNRTGGGGGSGGGGGGMLTSIDVSPSTISLVTTGGGAVATQQFTATGHFSDGHSEDISTTTGWSLSDVGVGTVTSGAFTGSATRGGVAVVSAGASGIFGTATVTVKYVAARVSGDDGSTAPAGAAGLFANATEDPTLAPLIAYPLDGTQVPHNLGLLEVQWKKPSAAADLFEVSFEGPTLDYKVYSNSAQPSGFRFSVTPADWSSIADTAAGTAVTVTVRGMISAQPGKAGTSQTVTMNIGAGDVNGGIYYWSPTGASGSTTGVVMRHSFGDTSGTAQEFYKPMTGANQRCVGCHVITHDGTKM